MCNNNDIQSTTTATSNAVTEISPSVSPTSAGANDIQSILTKEALQQQQQQQSQSVQQQQNVSTTKALPFYCSGGMVVNLIGIVINLILPIYVMLNIYNESDIDTITVEQRLPTTERRYTFIYIMLVSWFISIFVCPSKTTYCILVVPTYFLAFVLVPPVLLQQYSIPTVTSMILLACIVASMKVNICMSVCMHRYSSHAAFKCGYYTNIAILLLGCLANQGGPLWWASQHRCHHKFCELPRDPHSPKQVGTERAFGFFLERYNVDEEFVPKHINFYGLRVLDTWAFLVVSLELWFSYYYCGGNYGLFIAFTSGWMSQTISLWFNIANHPIVDDDDEYKKSDNIKDVCTASDGKADLQPTYYIPFYILDFLVPLYSQLAMEDNHEHHHNNANLAKRSSHDVAYYTFIKPLEAMGLVWNVVVK